MNYLSLLKEAVAPKSNKNQPPIIKDTNARKLDKNLQVDFKRLFDEQLKDNAKYSIKYGGEPVGRHFLKTALMMAVPGLFYIKDDSLLGFLLLLKTGERIKIIHFFVDPKYRSQGVGTALMKKAFKTSKKEGGKRIELDVWENNKNAQALYSKHGFKRMLNTMSKKI